MNNRKYKTNPDELLAQGQAIMSSSDESRYLFRVFAVNMVLAGTPASQVGASAGFTKGAVTGWVKTADEQGFKALRPQKRAGRPAKLSADQLKLIDTALQNDPKDHGFKVWDGPALSSHIRQKFKIEIGVRQCQRLFHSLGYSRIRTKSFPSKGYEDTKEREDFKKTGRNRKGRLPDPDLSGQSAFSDTDYGNLRLVQERKFSYGKILPWAVQGFIQRFFHPAKRGAVYRKTGNLQL